MLFYTHTPTHAHSLTDVYIYIGFVGFDAIHSENPNPPTPTAPLAAVDLTRPRTKRKSAVVTRRYTRRFYNILCTVLTHTVVGGKMCGGESRLRKVRGQNGEGGGRGRVVGHRRYRTDTQFLVILLLLLFPPPPRGQSTIHER